MKWTRMAALVILACVIGAFPSFPATSQVPHRLNSEQFEPSLQNVALGKPVTVTTNGANESRECAGMSPADITDGSLEYVPSSRCVEDGVVGYVNDDYNQLMRITITINLQRPYRVSKIRYNMGHVQRAETWNADTMITPFGTTGTRPGTSYNGAWTEHVGDATLSSVTIVLEKTRVSWPTDWLFVGEIEVYGTPAADIPMGASLVAYYNFDDGTASDASGYGNHGTIHGTPQTVLGVHGFAFRFGGWYDPDYIVVPSSSSLSFPDNFTFSLWFNIESNTSEDPYGNLSQYGIQTFMAKSGDRSGLTLEAFRSEADGLWYLQAQNGNCNLVGNCGPGRSKAVFTQPGTGVDLNQWHMMTVTYGNGVVRLYMDGILHEEMPASEFDLNTAMPSWPIYIGQELSGSYNRELWFPLNGSLDEIRIYNRVLSGDEIRELFERDAPALSIMGRVKDGEGNPVAGVVVMSSSGVSATTNASGGYRIDGLAPGVYTLTPQKAGHEFLPPTRTVSLPPNGAWQDFIMGSSITGRVRDSGGNPISGVRVLAGPAGSATTDATGAYTITLPAGLSAGAYSLAASRPGFTFTGPLVVSVPPDASGKDFVGTAGATDVTAPTGAIQSPGNSEIITYPGIYFTATAEDNPGGSGISRVEFYIQYNGKWRFLGQRTTAPFSLFWAPPAGLATQPITFTIHVYDRAGNVAIDPGGRRNATFLRSTQENWISTRGYLNQLALGANGWEMCSMASIAMVQASLGQIGTDFQSLQAAANAAWSSGLRAPGLEQVATYLESSNPSISAQAFTCSSTDAARCWSLIRSEIDADRPVIFNSPPSGSLTSYGHYLVVVGYSDAADPAQRQLIVYDPFGRWRGTQNSYDRNTTAVYTADGMRGRWRYYSFSSLAQRTLSVITVGPAIPTALGGVGTAHAQVRSQPDPVVVLDTEDVVTYVGVKPMTRLFLPVVHKIGPIPTPTPTPTPTVLPDPCQRYEPNNTLSTAWGPLLRGQAIEAALCSGDPDDYYYLDLTAAATLTLDLTNLPAGTDYELVLYNAGGSQIAASRNGGTTPERIVRSLGAGRYYVRVYPYYGRSTQPYRLTASWNTATQAAEPAPDRAWDKPPLPEP